MTGAVAEYAEGLALKIRGGRVAVFCGAGISWQAGLPLVGELLPAILRCLDAETAEIDLLLNARLPFEAYIEVLSSHSQVEALFDIFALGEPSAIHQLLAKLARTGQLRTIATTNFDRLFEVAMATEGLSAGRELSVAFDGASWQGQRAASKVRLLKLHGTIDDRSSLVATIREVSAKARMPWREQAIAEIFGTARGAPPSSSLVNDEELIVVIGYSCSDVFDLVPAIEALEGPRKRVLLVQHSDAVAIRELREQADGAPLRAYEGHLLQCNADVLIENLWHRLVDAECPMQRRDPVWPACVRRWGFGLETWAKHAILGALFAKISELTRAHEHYAAALARVQETDLSKVRLLLCLSETLRSLGRPSESLPHAQHGLALARAVNDKALEFDALSEVGSNLHAANDFHGALDHYQKATRVIGHGQGKSFPAAMLGQMAAARRHLGEHRAAIEGYRAECAGASQHGHKWTELANLINLGVCHRDLGEQELAIDVLKRARALSRDLRDAQAEMLCVGNLGNCYHDRSASAEALECYETVRLIAAAVHDELAMRTVLADLGRWHAETGDVQGGIELIESAIAMNRTAADREGESFALGHLGQVYLRAGKFAKARGLHDQARRLAEAVHAKVLQATHLANLATANLALGLLELGARQRKEALAVLEQQLGAAHPNVECVRQQMETHAHALQSQDTNLHQAALLGNVDRVREALDFGALVNAQNNNGQTALHIATLEEHADAVFVLLARGADPNIADRLDARPLHHAANRGFGVIAAKLLATGADANVQTGQGASALHLAAANGHAQILNLLANSGADIELRDVTGATPIHDAVERGDRESVVCLIAAGADVNATNGVGWRPLHIAARNGHEPIARLLLENGADPLAVTRKGSTARELALRHKNAALALALAPGGDAARAESHLPRARSEKPQPASAELISPSPLSAAAADRASELNVAYQRALAEWRALPFWQRLRERKPTAPRGV